MCCNIKICFHLTAGRLDYEELSALYADVFLPFDDDNRRLMFPVIIIDDDLFESVEEFNLELRFDLFGGTPSRVILSPNVSNVRILDDDGNRLWLL